MPSFYSGVVEKWGAPQEETGNCYAIVISTLCEGLSRKAFEVRPTTDPSVPIESRSRHIAGTARAAGTKLGENLQYERLLTKRE